MIPFNPNEASYLWWQAWRKHVKNAKRFPERADGYCRAAVIAQMEYEIAIAIRMVKEYY